jgi:HEAT repeat protein
MDMDELQDKGPGKKIESLIKLLRDERWLVRAKAAISLGRLGGRATVPALIQALSDENYLVAYHAADALKRIGTPEAVKALKVWEQNN